MLIYTRYDLYCLIVERYSLLYQQIYKEQTMLAKAGIIGFFISSGKKKRNNVWKLLKKICHECETDKEKNGIGCSRRD